MKAARLRIACCKSGLSKILILLVVVVIAASSIGVGYFALTQFTEPTASPTPTPSPTSGVTPTPSPTTSPSASPALTPTPTTSPTASPIASPSPSPIPSPVSWTIINVSGVETNRGLRIAAADVSLAADESDIFLFVQFGLKAEENAENLGAEDILVVVDGIHEHQPFFSTLGYQVQYDYHNFSHPGPFAAKDFQGTLTPQEASFTVTIVSGSGGDFTMTEQANLTELEFVYVLPEAYLDGSHNLQLRIADSAEKVEFTVKPP